MQSNILKKEWIKDQIKELLNEIEVPQIREQISNFFIKKVLDYLNEIDELNSQILKKKVDSEKLQDKLDRLNTEILECGYQLEESISDKHIIRKVKDKFRQLVGPWIYKSIILKRAYEKPCGYPGDYKLLELIYDNRPISKNIGAYFDNYFLKSQYAIAVRIRKDRLREILRDYINKENLNRINILNIACGSCREIRELLPNLNTKKSIIFTCLDWDKEALKFSKDALSPLTIKKNNIKFKFIKENIMNVIRNRSITKSLNKQNLIYSIGLIDYLPNVALQKLIYVMYQLLEKNGMLILTHKNKEKAFPAVPPDWACDWKFVSRNKDEVVELFYDSGISGFSLSINSDEFEYIYYFMLRKTKNKEVL